MIDETKIMQYADGTLPEDEKETVKKAIESNPQYQKLLKDYQETGKILFNLGKEIKSQPLPSSLQDKLNTIKEWKEKSSEAKKPFIFFKIPFMNAAIRNVGEVDISHGITCSTLGECETVRNFIKLGSVSDDFGSLSRKAYNQYQNSYLKIIN